MSSNRHLGLVASTGRAIKDGKRYDRYFEPCTHENELLNPNGTVNDTAVFMDKRVKKYYKDCEKIAPLLQGKTLEETCNNIWDFWYDHVPYKIDKKGEEQLRRPCRAWADRLPSKENGYEAGIDCDCYSIAIMSTLACLGVKDAKFRIADYGTGWQHVYVVVPDRKNRTQYVLDCVLDTFNEEKPYYKKQDYDMSQTLAGIPIYGLNGIGAAQNEQEKLLNTLVSGLGGCMMDGVASDKLLNTLLSSADVQIDAGLLGNGDAEAINKAALDEIYKNLVTTRDYIMANPTSVLSQGGARANLAMYNYAIENWHTPNRDEALAVLEKQEQVWNEQSGYSQEKLAGMDKELSAYFNSDMDDLNAFPLLGSIDDAMALNGWFKSFISKTFSGIKAAVTAVHKLNVKLIKGGFALAKNLAKEGLKVAKKVGKFLLRFNPITITIRAAILLVMRLNLFGLAKMAVHPEKFKKLEKLFVDIFQGRVSNLRKSVEKGSHAKVLQGADYTDGLGEPCTIATIITGAAGVVKAAAEIGKKYHVSELIDKVKGLAHKNPTAITDPAPELAEQQDPNDKASQGGEPAAVKAYDPSQAAANKTNNDASPATPSAGAGIMDTIKAHPIALGLGALAVVGGIAYAMAHKKSPTPRTAVNGIDGIKRHRKAKAAVKHKPIKAVKLK